MKRMAYLINGAAWVAFLSCVNLSGQVPTQPKPVLAEQIHKNIQILKGLPEDQFMATMGFISASLGLTCSNCHVAEAGGNWEKYAAETPMKQTSRRMMQMVNAINKAYFGGRREVTCYSCHRGADRPEVTPSLADFYGPPRTTEPDRLQNQVPKGPTPDEILDKYLNALGGAQRLSGLTSLTAQGTWQGFGEEPKPLELYAKTGQFVTVVRLPREKPEPFTMGVRHS